MATVKPITGARRARILADEMTNEEYLHGVQIADFLRWMRMESAPVPVDDIERDKLVKRWIGHRRLKRHLRIRPTEAR